MGLDKLCPDMPWAETTARSVMLKQGHGAEPLSPACALKLGSIEAD